jgi:hypothetical protein
MPRKFSSTQARVFRRQRRRGKGTPLVLIDDPKKRSHTFPLRKDRVVVAPAPLLAGTDGRASRCADPTGQWQGCLDALVRDRCEPPRRRAAHDASTRATASKRRARGDSALRFELPVARGVSGSAAGTPGSAAGAPGSAGTAPGSPLAPPLHRPPFRWTWRCRRLRRRGTSPPIPGRCGGVPRRVDSSYLLIAT